MFPEINQYRKSAASDTSCADRGENVPHPAHDLSSEGRARAAPSKDSRLGASVPVEVRDAAATADDVLAVPGYTLPFDFEIVGVSIRASTARTAGTLTADATIDGTVTGLQAALNATDTTAAYAKQPRESDRGVAGSYVGVKLTTASWTPITADIVVTVWVLAYLEGI